MSDNISYPRICKFGGSSLSSADRFLSVADIVMSDKSRKYIILSAPGKGCGYDTKITDLLYSAFDDKDRAGYYLGIVNHRFMTIAAELGLDSEKYCLSFDECMTMSREKLVSRGEYYSAMLFSDLTGFRFIDAADVIKFNSDGKPNLTLTDSLLKKQLENYSYAVFPGFYGSNENGDIVTFSRGGSDITGSLVALAANASVYENFTDVPGIMSADPRLSPGPIIIDTLDYRELRQLSYMGASVMHEESVLPLRGSGIPINIKSTFDPDLRGSLIVEEVFTDKKELLGVSSKNGFSLIEIIFENDMRSNDIFLGISSVFSQLSLNIEQISAGTDGFTVIFSSGSKDYTELERLLCSSLPVVSLSIICDISLVCIVGRQTVKCKSTLVAFGRLAENEIFPLAVFITSCDDEIIFALRDPERNKAIGIISKVISSQKDRS